MAGFRLWEEVSIEDFLDHLNNAVIKTLESDGVELPQTVRPKLRQVIKRTLNNDMYASPACGTSVLCRPSEEGRAKPWSYKSHRWGLVSNPDPSLERS